MSSDYLDPAEKRTRFGTLRQALWSERSGGFDAHWQDLAAFLMPRRTRFWAGDRNRGDKRNQHIIDSTGRLAARTLASGLHAGLTSPARPWMKLTTHDPKMAKNKAVAEWLSIVSERMLTLFATSNLYNVLPLVYLDMGIFATAAMAIVPDTRNLFRCYSYPIGSFALGQDDRGLVSTFIRDYQLTVRQLVKQFGVQADGRTIDWSAISLTVKDLWDRGDYERPIEVTWISQPNEDARTDRLDAKYLPFASCHFEKGGTQDRFLRESGFKTNPIMAPRWDITGEDTYGTDCPGMTALGDIRQLQGMARRKGQAISKAVDPPLMGPSSLRTQKPSLIAGDITYLDVREGMQGLKPIHEIRLEGLRFLIEDARDVRGLINEVFYKDMFLMLAQSDNTRGLQPITAREVDERHEEKLLALGPVLERTNDELLDQVVDRVFQLMNDAGMIPPAPPALRGQNLRVEYISILAVAQKLLGVTAQDRFLQSSAGLIEVFPEVRHKIKVFRVVDNYGEMLGVDPEIVRTDEEAQGLADQEAQAAQDAQQAANAAQVAKATKDAAAAPMSGDTVLSRLTDAAGRGGIPPMATGQPPAAPVAA